MPARESVPSFDLYAELEVSASASVETIEAAYRSLVKRFHPDIIASLLSDDEPVSEDRIKRINVARYWLIDVERRRRYDGSIRRLASRGEGRGDGGPGAEAQRSPWASTAGWTTSWEPASTSHKGFGPNTASVREFLAELRQLDEARAIQVRDGKASIDTDDYAHAKRAMYAISRVHRLSEWLFARDAATAVSRGQLGESASMNDVVDLLAEVGGAIAVRDLLPEVVYDTLREPWIWHGRPIPAKTPRPVVLSTTPPAPAPPAGSAWAAKPAASPAPHPAPSQPRPRPWPFGRRTAAPPKPAPKPSIATPRPPIAAPWPPTAAPTPPPLSAARPSVISSAPPPSMMASRPTTTLRSPFGPPRARPGATPTPTPRSTAPSAAARSATLQSAATRRAAVAVLSTSLVALIVLATLVGASALGGRGFSGGVAGIEATVPPAASNPDVGSATAPGSSSIPTATPTPSSSGMDPAKLAELRGSAATALRKLRAAAASGNVTAARQYLTGSARLQPSGLVRAKFASVAASAIQIAPGASGKGWLATAGTDRLTSSDGKRWTLDYGERPLAHFGSTLERDLFWREPLGQHDIELTITSVTIHRSGVDVRVAWRYGPDPRWGDDGHYYARDGIRIASLAWTGGSLGGASIGTLQAAAGARTATVDGEVPTAVPVTIKIAVVNHQDGAAARAFGTIEATFSVR